MQNRAGHEEGIAFGVYAIIRDATVSQIAISVFIMSMLLPLVAPYLAVVGIAIAVPAFSLGLLTATIAITLIVTELAYYYDSPNGEFDANKRFMTIATYMPSISSRAGIVWLFIRGLLFFGK
ncbi:hypothetical protein [Acidovorax sp. Leaf160]|uniref:hypothetical protein n=1 Tax=Acidovorax sp. Leaf160 TaxID=1736280 RepID=UPI0012E3BC06|nr:hypothetical protein [Acidovorax sp. Leaf160]